MRSAAMRVGGALLVATAVALFFASQGYMITLRPNAGPVPPFGLFFVNALIEWWGWAALAPLVLLLARRKPPLIVHAVAALGFAAVKLVMNGAGRALFLDYDFALAPRELHTNVIVYALLVGGAAWRERERAAARLAALLAEARLAALAAQLSPHFLFNTLNGIQSLVHDDPDTADRMISCLGELLRATLRAAGAQEVPLASELEVLAPYLEIQRARHGERLTVTIDASPQALEARVPSLILQPLVENAIRHGLAPRAAPGTVAIRAAREGGVLTLEVRDDGVGLRGPPAEGVGLRNTRQRLAELYGARGALRVEAAGGGGTVARVEIHEVAG